MDVGLKPAIADEVGLAQLHDIESRDVVTPVKAAFQMICAGMQRGRAGKREVRQDSSPADGVHAGLCGFTYKGGNSYNPGPPSRWELIEKQPRAFWRPDCPIPRQEGHSE